MCLTSKKVQHMNGNSNLLVRTVEPKLVVVSGTVVIDAVVVSTVLSGVPK